eukprot:TRINITY_DN24790_c0_g1_i1.p1 TRINITY_DN24790_c0_g1~~TRINITY_DN24790_c0_g1_i1.p1  ORF type:complete len:236 (+),score=45.90 TRINITY_DN24790_c0_g1_i1:53-709(+)
MPHTPDLSHIACWDDVYEPAQDSFLLLDAIEQDKEHFKKVVGRGGVAVEVGVGSGIVGAFGAWLAEQEQAGPFNLIGVDINPKACKVTQATYSANNVSHGEVLQSDLLKSFRKTPFIDIAFFNPPYVPSTTEEAYEGGITAAWAGGPRGRIVTDAFLAELAPLLNPGTGTLYLLLIHQNEPEEVVEILKTQHNCNAEILKERRYGEHAYVIKAVKRSS